MELYNPITKKWIKAYICNPKAALLINSPQDKATGIAIAEYICANLSSSSSSPLYRVDLADKKSIGIEEIREMQNTLSLRANGGGRYTRFVLIADADKLTVDAQNNLLKLLEELPQKTIVMLNVSDKKQIIQTVQSRCFTIPVLPITEEQANIYAVDNDIHDGLAKKAFLIAEGNRSMYLDIVNSNGNSTEELIATAKEFIQSSVFHRQKILQTILKNDNSVSNFINALKLTAKTGMRRATEYSSKQNWKNILSKIIITEEQIDKNVQLKLALLSLSVSI
jgi:DNA polymerase III delta prime subunit